MLHHAKESLHRFVRYVKWLYMLYELNTYISMCEPWEKIFLNTMVSLIVCFIAYSTFVYIPGYLYALYLGLSVSSSPSVMDYSTANNIDL